VTPDPQLAPFEFRAPHIFCFYIEIDGKNGMRAKFRIKNRVHSAALKSSFSKKEKYSNRSKF